MRARKYFGPFLRLSSATAHRLPYERNHADSFGEQWAQEFGKAPTVSVGPFRPIFSVLADRETDSHRTREQHNTKTEQHAERIHALGLDCEADSRGFHAIDHASPPSLDCATTRDRAIVLDLLDHVVTHHFAQEARSLGQLRNSLPQTTYLPRTAQRA